MIKLLIKYLLGSKQKRKVKLHPETIKFGKQIRRAEIKRAIKDFREYLDLLFTTEDGEIEEGTIYLNDTQAAVIENKIEEMRAEIKALFQARNDIGFIGD